MNWILDAPQEYNKKQSEYNDYKNPQVHGLVYHRLGHFFYCNDPWTIFDLY